jgi:hypothetical protein
LQKVGKIDKKQHEASERQITGNQTASLPERTSNSFEAVYFPKSPYVCTGFLATSPILFLFQFFFK